MAGFFVRRRHADSGRRANRTERGPRWQPNPGLDTRPEAGNSSVGDGNQRPPAVFRPPPGPNSVYKPDFLWSNASAQRARYCVQTTQIDVHPPGRFTTRMNE